MSSHQSTLVVPEDISHLHSHTSGPTNLHSIRLMLPKHPFDHDSAWVKQLQPRQHSSNKYLSFGSLGCRATATPMWKSHFALATQCSELVLDAGAEQDCVKHSYPALGTADFLLLPLIVWPWAGGLVCVGEGALFYLFTSWKLWLCFSYGTLPRFIRHQRWSQFCPPDSVPSCLELLLTVQAILYLFQNFTPITGNSSACPLPPSPNTAQVKGLPTGLG